MDDDNQIHIPDSFLALYSRPGSQRLTEPVAFVRERYELCEDLAQMLTEQASARLHELGITEQDVLKRIHGGLAGEGGVVEPREAQWVVHRLAELLGWPYLHSHPPT